MRGAARVGSSTSRSACPCACPPRALTSNLGYPSIAGGGYVVAGGLTLTVEL